MTNTDHDVVWGRLRNVARSRVANDPGARW